MVTTGRAGVALAAVGFGITGLVLFDVFVRQSGASIWLGLNFGLPLAIGGLVLAASQRKWLGVALAILALCGVALLVLVVIAIAAGPSGG